MITIDEKPQRNEKALVFRKKTGRPVVCTGGRSYYVVRGDGKIYRCLYNQTVIGHIQDENLNQLSGSQMVCLHKNMNEKLTDSCHPSGDLMFATYWEDGVMHEAPWPPWNENHNPELSVKDKAYFILLPVNSKCNLRCPYCCNFYYETPDGKIIGRPKDHSGDLPLDQYTSFVDKAAKVLKWAHFGFLGGEPTLYHALPELVAHIINKYDWEAGICSNMMLTASFEKIALLVPKEKRNLMKFSASLHPSSPGFSWEKYYRSVNFCKKEGFDVRATFVSWPEQTYVYEYYKNELEKIGVDLWLKGCGGYEMDEDWTYISLHGGTKQTPEKLKELGWIKEKN